MKEENQKKKLLICDFDGTLIDSEEAIPMTTVLAIDQFRNDGNYFVIVSGRVPASVLAYNQDFNFLDYVVACNGAYIYDISLEKVIYKKPLLKPIIRNIKQSFEGEAILYFCTPDDWHLYISTIYQKKHDKVMKSEIRDFNQFLSKNKNNIYKIEMIFETKDQADIALKQLKKMKLEIETTLDVQGEHVKIEITQKQANKYEAARLIAQELNIKMKDVYAIGDNLNDLKLIKRVGHGIAVENACQEIKEVAKEVTSSNNNLGVEKVLDQLNGKV